MVKKQAIILLAIVLMIVFVGSIPQPARATTGPVTRTQMLDVRGMETTHNDGEGWSWDKETKTLTLNNANIVTNDFCAINVTSATIVLHGKNSAISTYYNDKSSTNTSGNLPPIDPV